MKGSLHESNDCHGPPVAPLAASGPARPPTAVLAPPRGFTPAAPAGPARLGKGGGAAGRNYRLAFPFLDQGPHLALRRASGGAAGHFPAPLLPLHEPDVHPQFLGSARTCPRFVSTRRVASRKAATCRRTPRRCRGNWFMVPMHAKGRKEALHEPGFGARTALSARTRFAELADKAVRAPVRRGFMVPMHAKNRKEAFHEPGNIQHPTSNIQMESGPSPRPSPRLAGRGRSGSRTRRRASLPGSWSQRMYSSREAHG